MAWRTSLDQVADRILSTEAMLPSIGWTLSVLSRALVSIGHGDGDWGPIPSLDAKICLHTSDPLLMNERVGISNNLHHLVPGSFYMSTQSATVYSDARA